MPMLENGSGAVAGNNQNVPEAHVPRTYSTFPLKAHRFNTERYGEYTPIFAMEGVKNDKLPFNLSHQAMSYTLKSPLMQNVTKTNDLFSVPMEAILPLNWEKFFDNPVRGDDVLPDVGPAIEEFWEIIADSAGYLRSAVNTVLSDATSSNADAINSVLRYLVILECFYSNGSLMTLLGCHGASYVSLFDSNTYEAFTFDKFFDNVVSTLLSGITTIDVISDGVTYTYEAGFDSYYDKNNSRVPFRHILQLFRDDLTSYVDSATCSATFKADLKDAVYSDVSIMANRANVPFNTQFISAYQLVCAHYYTNDNIDFVYSAELYRQLIYNLLDTYDENDTIPRTFSRNGIDYQYDFLSAHYLYYLTKVSSSEAVDLLTVSSGSTTTDDAMRAKLGFYSNYWCFRRSLKYQDYFTGARVAPLAVGNTSISASGGTVSVLDVTRNIQMQRFLNSVNRVGHKFENYLKGLFGGSMPAPDYHNPFYLASHTYTIYGDETANTGDAQINPNGSSSPVAITTNLRGNGSNYMYEITPDRPCVIIALTHYDVPRVHFFTMDRSFLHVDRFDYFNPFLQYIGDQTIYLQELGIQGISTTVFRPFAYALRHMEYKQLYNTASGGFIENLPGWCFPANDIHGNRNTLSPDWIRAIAPEFDHFYVSLTGYSLASYFHFIIDNMIDCSGTRPMAFSPQILG